MGNLPIINGNAWALNSRGEYDLRLGLGLELGISMPRCTQVTGDGSEGDTQTMGNAIGLPGVYSYCYSLSFRLLLCVGDHPLTVPRGGIIKSEPSRAELSQTKHRDRDRERQ